MRHVFTIVPAGAGPLWFAAGMAVFLIGLMVLFGWIAWSSRHATFEISPGGLRLVGDLWGRRIPAAVLDVERARPVDLAREAPLRPVSRRMGTGLAGFAAGWFRLANGEKALIYLTDSRRVAYVPTRDGYVILLSVAEPERFVRVLRETVRR
ncbi:MAG TPA: PH domain-containing protein [Gemmatimonadales bacterium]|nr:PH domain-containing protein [Gemmatimonadales bacterium]